MKNKKILKLLSLSLVSLMMVSNVTGVMAEELPKEDDSNYMEVQSGGKEEREENDRLVQEKEKEVYYQSRGWGESCYPTVPVYKQEEDFYCGPASLSMTLKHITGTKYTQDSLASSAETTSSKGTYVYKMIEVLNAKQKNYKYAYTTVSSQSDLQKKVTSSIGKEAPVIFHTKTGSLAKYNGANLGHYVVGQSIYAPGIDPTVNVSYNDPWYKDYGKGNVYGRHTDKLSNFYLSLTKWGSRYLIYA